MSGIDTVFFDIGGVLVGLDFVATHRGFLADCRKFSGREFDDESLAKLFQDFFSAGEFGAVYDRFVCGRASEEEFLRAALESMRDDFGYCGDERRILATFNSLIGEAIGENVAVLQRVARNPKVKVGIISDTNASHVEVIRRRIPQAFEALPAERIFVSNELGCLKRDGAKIFEVCLQKTGSRAESSVMIDDYPRNLAYAREIGMQTVLVKPGVDLAVELRGLGVEL